MNGPESWSEGEIGQPGHCAAAARSGKMASVPGTEGFPESSCLWLPPDSNYSHSQTPSKHLSLTAGLTPTRKFWAAELCLKDRQGYFESRLGTHRQLPSIPHRPYFKASIASVPHRLRKEEVGL